MIAKVGPVMLGFLPFVALMRGHSLGPLGSVALLFVSLVTCGPPVDTPLPEAAREPPPGAEAAAAGGERGPREPEPWRVQVDDEDDDAPEPTTLEEQRERLFEAMARGLSLSEEQVSLVRWVFSTSPYLGQGNPALTQHPMSRAECRQRRADAGVEEPEEPRCGAPHMSALYNREAGEDASAARVCIDRFEFPGLPCEYPVVYARSSEAAILCRAVGKRLCDAHEWEGACAGSLRPPEQEYAYGLDRLQATHRHNTTRERSWAYGAERDGAACATSGTRSPGCTGEWTKCGSHTYPAGAFPGCRSVFGVYDLHGNAAEHMSLPLAPEERVAQGDNGWTEMKGSWFGFAGALPHEDDCRWRAPDWHATRVLNPNSHRNYHLGFRCCKDVGEDAASVDLRGRFKRSTGLFGV